MKRERVMRWEERESEPAGVLGAGAHAPWAPQTVKNNVPESGHGI